MPHLATGISWRNTETGETCAQPPDCPVLILRQSFCTPISGGDFLVEYQERGQEQAWIP